MNFFNRFKEKEIHVWVVISIFLLIGAGILLYEQYYSLGSYSYALNIKTPDGEKPLEYGILPSLENRDFYDDVRQELIDKKTSFVDVDLSRMKLKVYKDGVVEKEVSILTKGRKGSWWETPAGLYKVQEKIPRHVSSFSPVVTNWNIPFQGNFFIHGWPRYTSTNEPVSSSYSGGCIRLSDDDAKTVYSLVDKGMPILVYESASIAHHTYVFQVPTLGAESYFAADLGSNFVFFNNGTSTQPQASIGIPFLTSLVATDFMNIERTIPAMKNSAQRAQFFSPGKKYSLYNFLFPLLIKNSSEAIESIAHSFGEPYFLTLLNNKAHAIGMTHTTITDIYGKESTSITTTEDIFELSKYLYSYRKFILNLSNNKIDNSSYDPSLFTSLQNSSLFKSDPAYIGGSHMSIGDKTSEVAVFDIPIGNHTAPIVFIVINSPDSSEDIKAMRQYIETNYQLVLPN